MKYGFLCAFLVVAGCSKKPAPPAASATPETPAVAPAAAANAESGEVPAAQQNYEKTAERLTQALRKFSAENRRVPASLNELVAMGYLPEMPAAPMGKKWVFDDQLRVSLKAGK